MLMFFGALLLVPFALNFLASRDDYARYVDALFVSGMLCAIWAFTNTVVALWPFPQNHEFHPLVDLIGLSVAVAAYMTQRQAWKLTLAFLFLSQLIVHAWFRASLIYPPPMSGRDYVGLLNVLWVAQLICVGSPGGCHVAICALDCLRGDGRIPHPVRH
jgi:hypothetical protein